MPGWWSTPILRWCSIPTSRPSGSARSTGSAARAEGRAAGPAHVTGVEWTPITVDRRGGHLVHALPDITQGTATLTVAEVADRIAGVSTAAGNEAPERTTPVTPTGPPPVVVPRTAG